MSHSQFNDKLPLFKVGCSSISIFSAPILPELPNENKILKLPDNTR